jgi:hypothetical protein
MKDSYFVLSQRKILIFFDIGEPSGTRLRLHPLWGCTLCGRPGYSFVCDASLLCPERVGICRLLIRDILMLLILEAFSAFTSLSTRNIRSHRLSLEWRLAVPSAEELLGISQTFASAMK